MSTSVIKIAHLLKKYQRPGHRYAYYPNSSVWGRAPSSSEWLSTLEKSPYLAQGVQLYLHIPYCESLCTFCGCNINITRDHSVEDAYIETLIHEWNLYLQNLPPFPLNHLHLGGGTPTFFSPASLERLLGSIMQKASLAANFSGTVEIDPRVTTREHLKILKFYGLNSVSIGIQDTDEQVLVNVNRKQSLRQIQNLIESLHQASFSSFSFDLIYGLPFQSLKTVEKTFADTLPLSPHLVSFYSYAEVPWLHKMQNALGRFELPSLEEKIALFEKGREILLESQYQDLGFHHFAHHSSPLLKAKLEKRLHRNLSGLHDHAGQILLGLGASAISFSGESFIQNWPVLGNYQRCLQQKKLAIARGHVLTEEEKRLQFFFEKLICEGKVEISSFQANSDWPLRKKKLRAFQEDGLISLHNKKVLEVSDLGRTFLKEICMLFDLNLPC